MADRIDFSGAGGDLASIQARRKMLQQLLQAPQQQTQMAGKFAVPNRGPPLSEFVGLADLALSQQEQGAQQQRNQAIQQLLSSGNLDPTQLLQFPETADLGKSLALEQYKQKGKEATQQQRIERLKAIDPNLFGPAAGGQATQRGAQDYMRMSQLLAAEGEKELAGIYEQRARDLQTPQTVGPDSYLRTPEGGFAPVPGAQERYLERRGLEEGQTQGIQTQYAGPKAQAAEAGRAQEELVTYTPEGSDVPITVTKGEQLRRAKQAQGAGTPQDAARYFDRAVALLPRIAQAESSFQPDAVSPKGARGLVQIIPETAEYLSGKIGIPSERILSDPVANMYAGAYYLAEQLSRYKGDEERAVRAYNAGPGAEDAGRASTFPETQQYQERVLGPVSGQPGLRLEPPARAAAKEGAAREIASTKVKDISESYKKLETAPRSLENIRNARELIAKAPVGPFADKRETLYKAVSLLVPGGNIKALSSLQELNSALARSVLAEGKLLKGDLSEKEIKIIQESAGSSEFNPEALKRVLDLRERFIMDGINRHNQFIEKSKLPDLEQYRIDLPATEAPAAAAAAATAVPETIQTEDDLLKWFGTLTPQQKTELRPQIEEFVTKKGW